MTTLIEIISYAFVIAVMCYVLFLIIALLYFIFTANPNTPSEFHSRDRYQVAEDYAEQVSKTSGKLYLESLKFDENESQIFLQP